MPLRSIAFLLYFCGSSAATLIYPMIGIVCYIVLYHVFPQTTWWGKSLEFLGIRYSFILGAALLIGTFLNLGRLRFGRSAFHPLEVGLFLVFLTMLLSGVTGVGWDERTAVMLDKMAKVFLFCFMLSHVVVTRQRAWQLVVVLVLMALYLGHEAHIAPSGSFEKGRLNGIGGPDFRESAGLAIHLFALMPFVALVFRQKPLWLKAIAFFAGCYSVNAILLCRARSAFLAAMIVGVLSLFYSPKRHRKWIASMLVLASIGGIILSDNWFWERMVTIFSSEEERDDSAQSRFVIWSAAWTMIKENPQGVGIGRFENEIKQYDPENIQNNRDAHNTFVLCIAETGIPGITAFVFVLVMAWTTLSRLKKRVRAHIRDPDLFEWMIFANRLALLVYLISGFFVSRYYTEGFWWFAVMPALLARCVENEIRDRVVERERLLARLFAWAKGAPEPQLAT